MEFKYAYQEYPVVDTEAANWLQLAMAHAREAYAQGGLDSMDCPLEEKYVPVVKRILDTGLYPGYYFDVKHNKNSSTIILSDEEGDFAEMVAAIVLQEMMGLFEGRVFTPARMAFTWVEVNDTHYPGAFSGGACVVSAARMKFSDTGTLVTKLMEELRNSEEQRGEGDAD